jgi:hypothetical protein
MAQTLFSKIKGFCTTQNNAPAVGLALIEQSIDHMMEHRDWDALAYFLGHAPANMKGIARRIATECIGGAEMDVKSKVAKAHRCKVVFKLTENMGTTDRMAELRAFVSQGKGLTSKEVREAFSPAEEDKTRDELLVAYAKRLKALEAKIADEAGITWEDVMKKAHPEYAM